MILSGNSVEHLLLSLGAYTAGVPGDADQRRLLADERRPCADQVDRRADPPGVAVRRRCAAVLAPRSTRSGRLAATLVARGTRPGALRARRAARRPAERPRSRTRSPASAPDTTVKLLFTSGSTGVPKGVINTNRMLCSNQAVLASDLAVSGRRAAGARRLAAVEPHVRRQPQPQPGAVQRRDAVHR